MLQNLNLAASDKGTLQLAQLKCDLVARTPIEQIFPRRGSVTCQAVYIFFLCRKKREISTYLATSTFDSIVLSLSANESVWKTIPFCNNAPVISETIFCLISFVLAHFSKNVPPFRAHNNKSTYRHIVKDVVDSS